MRHSWAVSISPHARIRMRQRHPDVKPARMVDEVRAALLAGRVATERPEWCSPASRRERLKDSLYVWTENEMRTYALTANLDCFVIATVFGGEE